MVDLPGRPAWEPEDRADQPDDDTEAAEDGGWGSPVPAEYGSLHALRPPARKQDMAVPATGLFSAWARATRKPAGAEEPPVAPAQAPEEAHARPERVRLSRRPADTATRPEPDRAEPASAAGAVDGPERPEAAGAPTAITPAVRSSESGPPRPGVRPEPAALRERAAQPESEARPEPSDPAVSRTESVRVLGAPAGADGAVRPDPTSRPDPRYRSDPVSFESSAAAPGEAAVADAAGAAVADADPTAPIGPAGTGSARPVSPLRRPGRRPGRVRSRVVLRHIDVATVVKVSVLFWLLVLVVIVVAAVLLWVAADAFGTLPSIDKSVRTLFSLRKFELHPGAVAMYTAAAGLVIAIVGTLASILLALIYNLIADVVGGIRVELESFGRD